MRRGTGTYLAQTVNQVGGDKDCCPSVVCAFETSEKDIIIHDIHVSRAYLGHSRIIKHTKE